MSEPPVKGFHSFETMARLKQSALTTHGEHPFAPDPEPGDMSRRDLLKTLSRASALLMLGAAGCERKPKRQIISRVDGPEYQKPGKALYYASTYTEGSYPYGLLVKAVDGRPIKVDGNPEHPVNKGTSTADMQAVLQTLYDPDRLRGPRRGGAPISWEEADAEMARALRGATSVVLLTRANLGPSERVLIGRLSELCPGFRHFVHETAHDGPRRSAWGRVYGQDGELLPEYHKARVIVSFDADFLGTDGIVLENTAKFVQGRAVEDERHAGAEISRLYVAESLMTLTGSNADHRIPLRASAMGTLALALLGAVGGDPSALRKFGEAHHLDTGVLEALAKDLAANRGAALAVAGAHLPAGTHAAVALLNDALGAHGELLRWNPAPATLPPGDPEAVGAALNAGPSVLICLGVNPFYDWPGGGFSALAGKAGLVAAHDLCPTETLDAATLALPSSHNMESWGDAAPRLGLESLCQPVIAPLFDTREAAESLLRWAQALAPEDDPLRQAEDWHGFVRGRWTARFATEGAAEPARSWEDALRDGFIVRPGSLETPAFNREAAEALASAPVATAGPEANCEVVLAPHHAVYDGRFANNAWLHEQPDPITKIVWDGGALVGPATAKALGVKEGDYLRLSAGGASASFPVIEQPGAAPGVVGLTLGYGRTAGGLVVKEAGGVNAAALLGSSGGAPPRLAVSVRAEKAEGAYTFARTQTEFSMHGRPIVLDGTLEEYRHDPAFVGHKRHLPEMVDLYTPHDYSRGHKWAMAIDLNACTGCGACMSACQSENNITPVGRDECGRGREMHWIRIDRYVDGDPQNPEVRTQPMLCQHCDNAPCENVCPVNATTHSPEGLNEMAYNRCVGTRYCANNCPYKVRRFNFYDFQSEKLRDPVQELGQNPQVTVRGVGVMEKCTFCVQRISAAKHHAANTGSPLADGAVKTACQQACPAQAIVFGDVNDPSSRISRLLKSGRGYRVLEELNVRPNVTYLARLRNPHPDLSPAGGHNPGEAHHG